MIKKLRIKVILTLILCALVIPLGRNISFGATAAVGVNNFPASYQSYLNQLKSKYPNWEFVALNTGLDWNTVIQNEKCGGGKNLVQLPCDAAMQCQTHAGIQYDAGGWYCASEDAVKYYMDPRNFLDEQFVFQFELLSYDSSVHTQQGVESILSGTFMYNSTVTYRTTSNTTATISKKYSQIIMEAASSYGVSPYYLASKIRQEVILSNGQGSNSITGTVSGYTGIYNFYNIGATQGSNPIGNGLTWAQTGTTYQRPWIDPEKAIKGGAQYIAEGYINVGQDTGYLQKFNVNPSNSKNLYTHQYMGNVGGAVSEASKAYSAYANNATLSSNKVFYIPVYNNMPSTQCYRPSGFGAGETNLYVINGTSVSFRNSPSTTATRIKYFELGETVKVLNLNAATSGGYTWAQVKTVDGTVGYLANTYLTYKRCSDSFS